MGLEQLQDHLEKNFFPPAAAGFDATFRLVIASQPLCFRVREQVLQFTADVSDCDVTFTFADIDTAWTLLSGQTDAIEPFMEGRFRADGYLMWAFSLMAMFRSASLPAPPTE